MQSLQLSCGTRLAGVAPSMWAHVLLLLSLAVGAAGDEVPVLGNSYVLSPLLTSMSAGTYTDGPFATAQLYSGYGDGPNHGGGGASVVPCKSANLAARGLLTPSLSRARVWQALGWCGTHAITALPTCSMGKRFG